jgi:CBS domain containing-hemolysin-like protein
MPDSDSIIASRNQGDAENEGRIWQRLRALVFGSGHEPTLREQIEEKIAEHEEEEADSNGKPTNDGDLTATERKMLRNLLHFSEHRVDDVMVPRGEIVAISDSSSFADTIAAFVEHGHSRMPVYQETLDHIIGMVHIKDLFMVLAQNQPTPEGLAPFIRQPRFVPQSMSVLELLDEMRRTRTHLAIIVDEYSGTEGMVTIEDLVEEIVGEIEDEHDDEPEILFSEIAPGLWEADARTELDDIAEAIDSRLSLVDGDVDTLGGLTFVIAGQVPSIGAILLHEASGWRLEILDGDEKRVTRVRLHAPKPSVEVEIDAV